MDEARAVLPRKNCQAFLCRNVRSGARRMHSYKTFGDTIIEEEPDESRESTPEEEDTDGANRSQENGKTSDLDKGSQESGRHMDRPVRKAPDSADRDSTSFLVRNDLRLFPVNTSFGFFTTHEGTSNIMLRRGAPFLSRRVSQAIFAPPVPQASQATMAKRSKRMHRLLRKNKHSEGFAVFEAGTTVQKRPHPHNPNLHPSNLFRTNV